MLDKILSKCVPVGTCLEWTEAFQKSGRHGQLWYPNLHVNGKTRRGNRVVYELVHKITLTREQHVCHTCDNSKCLNPEHLFLGSHTDNMQDKIAKGRDHNKKKTHCKNGHPFIGENLITRKDGARSCRQCMRVYWNSFDAKNREKRRVLALQRYYARKEAQNDNTKIKN